MESTGNLSTDLEVLIASQDRYRLLAENASDVVTLGSNEGVWLWLSPSVEQLLGWRPDELVGKPARNLFHPDSLVQFGPVNEALLRGEPGVFEAQVRTKDGSYRWVSARLKPILNDDGNVLARVGGWRDVQEEHDAREALTASEERYRLMAENASDIVLMAQADGAISWVSQSITAVLGWRPEQVVGHRPMDLIHPDDAPAIVQAQGRIAQGETLEFEARVRTSSDGYRWVASRVSPVFDDSGVLSSRVAAWRDIEDAHAAREALRESETRYRLLAENVSDIAYQSGPDRLIRWIAPTVEMALGWTPEELVGTSFNDLIHPDDRHVTGPERDRLYSGESPTVPVPGLLIRVRAKDGGYLWFSGTARPLLDSEDRPVRVVAGLRMVDDLISERHRAQDESERRQALLETLLDPHVLLRAVRDDAGVIVDFIYVDANDAACEYNHTAREQLMGARLLELVPGQVGRGMLAVYAAAVESGQPLILHDYAYPNEIVGSERRFDIRAMRVGDALSLTWRDVTDRFESALQLAESERRFRLLAENSSDVVLQSSDGIMRWLSPSLKTELGWDPSDWVGHGVQEFTHPDDMWILQQAREAMRAGASQVGTMRLRDKAGVYHFVELHSRPHEEDEGDRSGIVATFRVVDQEVAARQQLERFARFDTLTGALNRSEILHKLSGISAGSRRPGEHTAVLFCDIDHFKDVNDTYGHAAGDEVLRRLAERIQAAVRDEDFVARIGGDELLVILTAVHGLDDATAVAEKIREAASVSIGLEGARVTTTLSIGVTLMRSSEDVDSLIARADEAMYEAKSQGRNQVVAIDAGD